MQQVQVYRAPGAGELFADFRPERPAFQPHIGRGEGYRLQPMLPGNPEGARTMVRFGNDRTTGQVENFLRPHHGIQRAEAGVVACNGVRRHPGGDEGVAHIRRLVIAGNMVITAHEQVVYLAGLVEGGGGGDTLDEMQIGLAVPGDLGGAQNQAHLVGGNGGGRRENSPGRKLAAGAVGGQHPASNQGCKNHHAGDQRQPVCPGPVMDFSKS